VAALQVLEDQPLEMHGALHRAREGFVIVEEGGLLRRAEIQIARRSRCGEIEVAAQCAQQDLAREAYGATRPGGGFVHLVLHTLRQVEEHLMPQAGTPFCRQRKARRSGSLSSHHLVRS